MRGLFTLVARFEDAQGKPLGGAGFEARFYDKDILGSDHLASAPVDPTGLASAVVASGQVTSWDSPGEAKPDVWVALYEGGKQRFKSKVHRNLTLGSVDSVTGQRMGAVDLGTFRVE